MNIPSNRLRAKDLITTAIFTVLYFVVIFAFAMALMALPFISLFITCFVAVFGGVIFLYLVTKVRKFGAVTILSAIVGIASAKMQRLKKWKVRKPGDLRNVAKEWKNLFPTFDAISGHEDAAALVIECKKLYS